MKSARTSVAMCTFNGSRFLREQLQSIASQTMLPSELVICDDLSSDDTISIIKDFASQAAIPVRLFQNEERLGPSRNFDKAIGLCTGEIILLSDQDDIWAPGKVQRLVEALDSNRAAVYAFSDADMVDEYGKSIGQSLWEAVGLRVTHRQFRDARQLQILLKHNVVTGATMAIRSSLRDAMLPIPPAWMHDYWAAILGSTVSNGIPVSESLIKYRRHASQVCGHNKSVSLRSVAESLNTHVNDWRERVLNFRVLLERLASLSSTYSCPPDRLQLLKEKELHLNARCETRSIHGFSRIVRVLAEASTGRYHRFSESWYSIVRDL
jgi:glycosyltransferase involved in cell wall biosynthesis